MPEQIHIDVAAYALGGLDPQEDEAFRTHLDECPTCWAELESMVDVTSLLSRLDPAEVLGEQEKPGPQVLDGMLREVRSHRRQARYRSVLAAAAAVALIVAGPIVVSQSLDSGNDSTPQARQDQTTSPQPQPPPAVLAGTIFSGADAATGVSARVGLEKKLWGTSVGLELKGIKGPLECSLIAVSATGERQVVTTWAVPPKGYGVPGSPAPLLTRGGAALTPDQIARLEVRTLDGETKVTVPIKA